MITSFFRCGENNVRNDKPAKNNNTFLTVHKCSVIINQSGYRYKYIDYRLIVPNVCHCKCFKTQYTYIYRLLC